MSGATNFTLFPFAFSILDYSYGIELDSTGAMINNDYGAPMCIKNVSTGVLINNTTGNFLDGVGMHAQYNGIWIQGGSGNLVTGYETSIETHDTGTNCEEETVASNSDGIRIDNSTGNVIYQVDVARGDSTGVHLVNGSRNNFVLSNLVQDSGVGISIKDGTGSNVITSNTLTNNQLDLEDGNSGCDHNLWVGDTYSTHSPKCAQ